MLPLKPLHTPNGGAQPFSLVCTAVEKETAQTASVCLSVWWVFRVIGGGEVSCQKRQIENFVCRQEISAGQRFRVNARGQNRILGAAIPLAESVEL